MKTLVIFLTKLELSPWSCTKWRRPNNGASDGIRRIVASCSSHLQLRLTSMDPTMLGIYRGFSLYIQLHYIS
ncbi:mCG1049637 [Mus musculus]|nr:mCG1049637 [Mus musculus]